MGIPAVIAHPKDVEFSKGKIRGVGRAFEAERRRSTARNASVRMIVEMALVAGVIVVASSMLTAVVMVVHMKGISMRVLMKMFVGMLMGMGVCMLVAVILTPVGVPVSVNVPMFVRVHVPVLMSSFHGRPPVHQVFGSSKTRS
jgi:hypothetical protein